MTYVDLNLYLIVNFMKLFKEENLLDEYPGVKKLTDAVGALPNNIDAGTSKEDLWTSTACMA